MEAIAQEPIFASMTQQQPETGSMPALVQGREISLQISLPHDLETMLALPYGWKPVDLVDIPSGFLSELKVLYSNLIFVSRSIRANYQFSYNAEQIAAFLNSSFFAGLREQLKNDGVGDDDDAETVIRYLLCTLSVRQTVVPAVLAEAYLEIVRESKPTKIALHFTRLSIRNNFTFIPSPKEFRDTLLSAVSSLAAINEEVTGLVMYAEQSRNDPEHRLILERPSDSG